LDYAIQIDDPIIAKDFNYFAETSFFREDTFSKEDRICFKYKDKTIVSIIQNDWLKRKNEIYDAYINSFTAKRNCHSGKLFSSW
jgi:cardiolipin synthase